MSSGEVIIHKLRASGWRYDLSSPDDNPACLPDESVLPYPPNHIDDVYMELPRATFEARGIGVLGSIGFFGVACAMLFQWLGYKMSSAVFVIELIDAVEFFVIVSASWLGIFFWRMDLAAPKDEPIRFNRIRRKVYVYQFHYSGLRLFCRKSWGVRAVAYDWDSLKAEFCSIYGPMGTGGLIQFVNLAVFDAQGEKIVDRFLYARGRQSGEMYWAMAQLYMQEGTSAVPKFEKLPRDWNNETHFENIARRFAPKVIWPEAMDVESRSAP